MGAWCAEAGGYEGESWLLVENAGQERWLRRKGAEGVRIFDAAGLRDELARRADWWLPPRGPAAATYAVKVAAAQSESEAATAAGRDAGILAEACCALAGAGWHLNQLAVAEDVAQGLQRTLNWATIMPAVLERMLRKELPAQKARLCCMGWDASHWPDIGLLDVAASKTERCDLYVPMPRLPADALQREWIDGLEERLGLERGMCAESGFSTQNEGLVSRLEKSGLASRAEARAPVLLVGREWGDQVGLVCKTVSAWLRERDEGDGPIGVIGPEDSVTAIAVGDALAKAGVGVERPGRRKELAPDLLVLEQTARYYLRGHDVEELIELCRLLWLHCRDDWEMLEPEGVRNALDKAFKEAQTRNARILVKALPYRKDALWTAVCKLVEALPRWDRTLAKAEVLGNWNGMMIALRLPPEPLGGSYTALGAQFRDERVPGMAFVEWLSEYLGERRREVGAADFASGARVVVTSFANAAQQPWGRVIFLDSNEHVWPPARGENRYLPDATIARLNGRRKESGRLLSTRDLRVLEEARFLDLIEQTRGRIAFAGVLREQMETGDHAQPNEWVLRAMIETAGEGSAPVLEQWAASAVTRAGPPGPGLEEKEREHMQRVNASRRMGTVPFDSYLFDFSGSKIECEAWSATDLDAATVTPATFALKVLFGAEATVGRTFSREEGVAIGNRVHRWLGRILGGGDGLAQPAPEGQDAAKLAREMENARKELEEWFAAEGMAVPIWWETSLRKTGWAARRCLREVRVWLEGQYCATEQTLAVRVQTAAGMLPLKGRVDIVISDRPEIEGSRVRVFDFKTGRTAAPTMGTLDAGKGMQFAAYYLMARDAGALEAVVGIIKPEARAQDVFQVANEAELRARFGRLAELARSLRFGRLGPLVSEYGVCETLPLATVPIDPAILEQKAELFLLA